jgi:hypothetical protein
MKDYKKTYCIEGEFFACPNTVPPVIEEEGEEPSKFISRKLPLSTDHYSRSIVKKRTIVIYEKKK